MFDNFKIVNIREYAGDKDLLLNFVVSAYIDGLSEENTSSDLTSWRTFHQDAASLIRQIFQPLVFSHHPDHTLYLALLDDVCVGYAYVFVKTCHGEIPERVGVINGLYISPAYRKRGYAQLLLDQVHKDMAFMRINYLELIANLSNHSALAFWKKNGFIPVEQVMGKRL